MPELAVSRADEHEFTYRTVRSTRVFWLGLYLVGLIVYPVLLFQGFRIAYPADRVLLGFFILCSGVYLYVVYSAVTLVFEVTLGGHTLRLRSLTRQTALNVGDVRMFTHGALTYYVVNLRSARGTFHLLVPMDQLHDLIARVRSLNPHVATRGI